MKAFNIGILVFPNKCESSGILRQTAGYLATFLFFLAISFRLTPDLKRKNANSQKVAFFIVSPPFWSLYQLK